MLLWLSVAHQAVQAISAAVADLDLDDEQSKRDLVKVLGANASWAGVFLGDQVQRTQSSLVHLITDDERWTKDLYESDADDFKATVSELGLKLRRSVATARTPEDLLKANATAVNTYLEERDKLRDKKIIADALAKESKRLESAARKAAGLTDKATTRDGKSPPAKPSGAAGSGTLSAETINQMSESEYDQRRPEILKWQSQQLRS
jgi:hypothetical protein